MLPELEVFDPNNPPDVEVWPNSPVPAVVLDFCPKADVPPNKPPLDALVVVVLAPKP